MRWRTRTDARIDTERREAARVARVIRLLFPSIQRELDRFPTDEARAHALTAIGRMSTRGAMLLGEVIATLVSFGVLWLLASRMTSWMGSLEAQLAALLVSLAIGWVSTRPLLLLLLRSRIRRLIRTRLGHEGLPTCLNCGADLRNSVDARCPRCSS